MASSTWSASTAQRATGDGDGDGDGGHDAQMHASERTALTASVDDGQAASTSPAETAAPPPPPPPPPPPYWIHSRAAPDAPPADATSAAPAASKPSTLSPRFFLRRPQPTAPPPPPTSTSMHRRDTSTSTLDLQQANLITLQDNEAPPPATAAGGALGPDADGVGVGVVGSPASLQVSSSSRCWARRVDITGYVVVNGGGGETAATTTTGATTTTTTTTTTPGIGAFVVWTVRVQTLEDGGPGSGGGPGGTSFCIYKRYSEFDALRRRLAATFPQARDGGALPPLPPKRVLGKFRPAFLEQRRLGLEYFLNCVLLNPEFAGAPVLQEFLFG